MYFSSAPLIGPNGHSLQEQITDNKAAEVTFITQHNQKIYLLNIYDVAKIRYVCISYDIITMLVGKLVGSSVGW
jgi:hypothetical protein